MGLLSKANLVDLNTRLAFSDFIINNNIKFFAIFEKLNQDYLIKNSLGFDGNSIFESISTVDFWNGICKENKSIYNFNSLESTNPLLQFFSIKIKDDIKSVSVCKCDNNILMLCNQEITNSILEDFSNLDFEEKLTDISKLENLIAENSNIYNIELDFDEAIQTFIYTNLNKKEYSKKLSESLFNELSNRIFFQFNIPDASVKLFDNKIKTVFISNYKIARELLINHLILNYKEVVDNAAEVINIDLSDQAKSYSDIKEFLKVE